MSTDLAFLSVLFIIGTIIGSFLNVIIYRLPLKQSLIKPASHCPNCKTRLKWHQNIPLWSFIWLQGKCGFCKHPISWRYPTVELISGFIFVLMFIEFGITYHFFKYTILLLILLAMGLIDIQYKIIPNSLVGSALIAGAGFAVYAGSESVANAFTSVILGGSFMLIFYLLGKIVYKKEALGGGDIKLVAVLGVYLVWYKLIIAIFAAFILIAIFGWVGIVMKKCNRHTPIPMAPFLAISVFGTIYYGFFIWHWYSHWIH